MKEQIRIGAWQGPVAENDPDRNIETVKSVVRQGAEAGLDFLCFPECFLSGYTPEAIAGAALSPEDPRLQDLAAYCGQYDMVVLVGLCLKREDGILNGQLVTYRGDVLGISPKTMLTEYDARYFLRDLSLPVYEAKGVRFGVAICHSTSFVEPALCLRWKGARLLFTPHYNHIRAQGFDGVTFWAHRSLVLRNQAALATLLKMVVVRSNITGWDDSGLSSGDSGIWDMDGEAVVMGVPFTQQLVTAAFDRAIFEREHWIDRREVPLALLEETLRAAREYPRK